MRITRADGSSTESVGGAAFISALACRWSGVSAGVVARVPTRLPDAIAEAFGPGGLDRGGLSADDGPLPTFHIAYDADHRATYTHVDNGLERRLEPADLPPSWRQAPAIHLAAIGADAGPQQRMLAFLREAGFSGRVSAGTYRPLLGRDLDGARALLAGVDLFFGRGRACRRGMRSWEHVYGARASSATPVATRPKFR